MAIYRPSTAGQSYKPTVWQMLCSFANGRCHCAEKQTGPCETVTRMEALIRAIIIEEEHALAKAERAEQPRLRKASI